MAVPVIADSTAHINVATGGTITLTKPTTAGISAGDGLLMLVCLDSTNTNVVWTDITGWTQIFTFVGGLNADVHLGGFYRVANEAEDATEDVITVSDTGKYLSGYYLHLTGSDAATPINVVGAETDGGGALSHTATEVTTDIKDCLGFALIGSDGFDTAPASTVSTGWSIWGQQATSSQGQGANQAIATKTISSLGVSGDCVFDIADSDSAITVQFAVAPGDSSTTTTQIGDIQMVLTVSGNQGIVP